MALTNIVLADSVPTNHTFVGIADGNEARYVNDAGSFTLKGQETLGFEIKRATGGTSPNIARVTLWDPKELLVDGSYVIDHGNSADVRFNFAQTTTEVLRLDLITMMIALLTAKKVQMSKLQPDL